MKVVFGKKAATLKRYFHAAHSMNSEMEEDLLTESWKTNDRARNTRSSHMSHFTGCPETARSSSAVNQLKALLASLEIDC